MLFFYGIPPDILSLYELFFLAPLPCIPELPCLLFALQAIFHTPILSFYYWTLLLGVLLFHCRKGALRGLAVQSSSLPVRPKSFFPELFILFLHPVPPFRKRLSFFWLSSHLLWLFDPKGPSLFSPLYPPFGLKPFESRWPLFDIPVKYDSFCLGSCLRFFCSLPPSAENLSCEVPPRHPVSALAGGQYVLRLFSRDIL